MPPSVPSLISYGASLASVAISLNFLPINLFVSEITFFGSKIVFLFAKSQTNISSPLIYTIDGVVLVPSEFAITSDFPHIMYATQEFVVPKSIPIIFHIL
jgi:hypothetical protein